jgi:hypothetical protein
MIALGNILSNMENKTLKDLDILLEIDSTVFYNHDDITSKPEAIFDYLRNVEKKF